MLVNSFFAVFRDPPDKGDCSLYRDPRRPLTGIDATCCGESLLDKLDSVARKMRVHPDLLRASPALELRRGVQDFVTLLTALDVQALLRHQGPLSRLTGKDIEARYVFNDQIRTVQDKAAQLRRASKSCGIYAKALISEKHRLEEAQSELEILIEQGRSALDVQENLSAFTRTRIERRLVNLTAMQVSNVTTIRQLETSVKLVTTLLDRFADVEAVVLPLWERHALAIANSNRRVRETDQIVQNFHSTSSKLVSGLQAGI